MKKATRVNAHSAFVHSFPPVLGDKGQACMRSTGVLITPKDENVALPPSINIWKQPVYVPEKVQPARPGADNHLQLKSRGL